MEEQTAKTPLSDLRRSALENYQEASDKVHHWNNAIPKAINHYFDHLESTTEKQEPDSVKVSQKKENIINILNKRLIIANESDSNVSLPRKFIKDFINFLSLQEPRQTKSETEPEYNIHQIDELLWEFYTKNKDGKGSGYGRRLIQQFALQSVPERPEQKDEYQPISILPMKDQDLNK